MRSKTRKFDRISYTKFKIVDKTVILLYSKNRILTQLGVKIERKELYPKHHSLHSKTYPRSSGLSTLQKKVRISTHISIPQSQVQRWHSPQSATMHIV